MGARSAMTPHVHLFEDLDRLDAEAWLAHLSPDIVMRFACEDPVYGHAGARRAAASLFRSVDSMHHQIVERWEHGAATIVEAVVTFEMPDGAEHVVPMVTIYRTDQSGLIVDYRVYLDPSGLWP